MNEIPFQNMIVATVEPGAIRGGRVTPPHAKLELAAPDGTIAVEGSKAHQTSLEAMNELLRDTARSNDRDKHIALGAAVREPIRQLIRYQAWTGGFFAPDPRGPTDDNRIPVDQPIGMAFYSSPEGKPVYITQGVQQWVRPSFFESSYGVQIRWKTLETAGWPVLKRRMEECADHLAKLIDLAAQYHLHAAAAAVAGHISNVTGGSLTKASIDTLIKSAAQTFPITQGAINPGRIMDMTGWTNGSTNALPFFWAPQSASDQVYKQLYAEGYGNIRWLVSQSVPIDTIFLTGEPEDIGYHQTRGDVQSASDVDIELRLDKHVVWREDAFYVGNNYPVYEMAISA